MKKNILITGALGQLGKSLQKVHSIYFHNHYNLFLTDIDNLDITHKQSVEKYVLENDIHLIINAAAFTAVDKAETERETAFLLNATAVGNLAQICKDNNLLLIHISTDYVFDGKSSTPYSTSALKRPISIYGQSKAAGEEHIATIGGNCAIVRTSWLYSEFGNNFLKTMLRLGREKSQIQVVSDQYGAPTYATDLALTIYNIVEKMDLLSGVNVYHFANEGVTTWFEFAQKIMEKAKLSCQVFPIPTSAYPTVAKRPQYSVFDLTQIKKDFSIEIPHWETSLDVAIKTIATSNS